MKSVATVLFAGLMLLGTVTAIAVTNHPKSTTVALTSDGGPMPGCYPTEPDCKPPIPPR